MQLDRVQSELEVARVRADQAQQAADSCKHRAFAAARSQPDLGALQAELRPSLIADAAAKSASHALAATELVAQVLLEEHEALSEEGWKRLRRALREACTAVCEAQNTTMLATFEDG